MLVVITENPGPQEKIMAMNQQPHVPLTDDHAFPMAFVVMPAFVGALLWLITMLSRFAQ
jgi:hypothetical protein